MAFDLIRKYKDRWQTYKSDLTYQFYSQIDELLENDMVRRLDDFSQHLGYSRLSHSLDVAYYSYIIARLLRWDARSVARGGLLHDLFLYNWRDEGECGRRRHAAFHPVVALGNARTICTLNKIEENIIRRHMWLATLIPPRYKEGYIVTFVDKYCAAREFFCGLSTKLTASAAVIDTGM